MSQYRFSTTEQEAELIAAYAEVQSYNALAQRYQCSRKTIRDTLLRLGIEKSSSPPTSSPESILKRRFIAPEQEGELITAYIRGDNCPVLAERYGCAKGTIQKTLRRLGVTLRPTGGRHIEAEAELRAIPVEDELYVVKRYISGETAATISRDYGCTTTPVLRILRRLGVPRRNKIDPLPQLSDEDIEIVLKLWDVGTDVFVIAEQIHTFPWPVIQLLQTQGYEISEAINSRRSVHPLWRGGRTKQGSYITVKLDLDDPMYSMAQKNGRVREHRLVMALHLGRPLRSDETVHHIDNNPANNHIDNLQLRQGRHGKGYILICTQCGSTDLTPMPIADPEETE